MVHRIYKQPYEPITATLRVRNFKAKLPNDFVKLLSIETKPRARTLLHVNNNAITGTIKLKLSEQLLCIPIEEMAYVNINPLRCPCFCIQRNHVLFSGNYNTFFIIRWIEILMDWIYPNKVILKYFNTIE
jgi:hypothetical protein